MPSSLPLYYNLQHTNQTPNRLAKALSPYLLQHAFNPVDWHEWGEEAFELAKQENKLVLVSIGYSACHWCHVMAHESFEDEETANMMNEMFVCIKVDREELPDVDQAYMDACQLINGSGGWPLNAFALPDRRPIHALTYLPKNQWQKLLQNIYRIWTNEPQTMFGYAEKMSEGMANMSVPPELVRLEELPKISGSALEGFIAQYDEVHGGPNRAPKFPMPNNYKYLLQHSMCFDNQKSRDMALFTLDQMALGGIWDVVGGGFARYSVDARWFAPHFEKMLYDNAQLLSLYSYAYAVSGKEPYKHVALQISNFCQAEMLGPEGLYYSAYDADSEGVEGLYYTYTYEELMQELGNDSMLFCQYFQCTREGNWEHGRNILYAIDAIDKAAKTFEVNPRTLSEVITRGLRKLKAFRDDRIKPGLDDKYICSWNCLMAKGLAESAIWLDNIAMAEQASQLAHRILDNFYYEGSLKRICKSGSTARIDAFIEDYATLIDALICVYQATFDEEILTRARELCAETIYKFMEEKRGFFRFSENQSALVAKYDISDDVINSGNSMMAYNLWRLSWYFSKPDWKEMADKMLDAMLPLIENSAPWYSNWAALQLMREGGTRQIILSGDESLRRNLSLKDYYKIPNAIFGFASENTTVPLFEGKEYGGQPRLYQCDDFVCHEPTAFEPGIS